MINKLVNKSSNDSQRIYKIIFDISSSIKDYFVGVREIFNSLLQTFVNEKKAVPFTFFSTSALKVFYPCTYNVFILFFAYLFNKANKINSHYNKFYIFLHKCKKLRFIILNNQYEIMYIVYLCFVIVVRLFFFTKLVLADLSDENYTGSYTEFNLERADKKKAEIIIAINTRELNKHFDINLNNTNYTTHDDADIPVEFGFETDYWMFRFGKAKPQRREEIAVNVLKTEMKQIADDVGIDTATALPKNMRPLWGTTFNGGLER
jgi:hypothetical protein